MSQLRSCPQGHRWSDDAIGSGAAAPVCPVCGAAGLVSDDTWIRPEKPKADSTPAEHGQAARQDAGLAETLAPESATDLTVAPPVSGYVVEGLLGRGGMGVVYRAQQVGLKRVVALKMILAGAHAGPEQLQRFRTEAEAVAALDHPNIVRVYEIGELDGLPFFSLEYCSGGNLAARLGGAPLQSKAAAELVATLARAVQAAHGKGIVHRDLKPANILLTADGIPKITDFGLAKRPDAGAGLTASQAVLGTPSYMAPEQASGRTAEIGPAADIYALGAILYETLTGRPPFRSVQAWDTIQRVIQEEPVPPRLLHPQVPRDLETICLKCLNKKPGNRYASATELGDDLERFLRGEPIMARPVGLAVRGLKWVRRRPTVAALLGLGILAAVAALVAGIMFARALRVERDRALELHWARLAYDDALRLQANDPDGAADLMRSAGRAAERIFRGSRQQNTDDVAEALRVEAGTLLGQVLEAQQEPVAALQTYLDTIPADMRDQLERQSGAGSPLRSAAACSRLLTARGEFILRETTERKHLDAIRLLGQEPAQYALRDLDLAARLTDVAPALTAWECMRRYATSGAAHDQMAARANTPAAQQEAYREVARKHLQKAVTFDQAPRSPQYWSWRATLGGLLALRAERETGARRLALLDEALDNFRSARKYAPEQPRKLLDERIATLEKLK